VLLKLKIEVEGRMIEVEGEQRRAVCSPTRTGRGNISRRKAELWGTNYFPVEQLA